MLDLRLPFCSLEQAENNVSPRVGAFNLSGISKIGRGQMRKAEGRPWASANSQDLRAWPCRFGSEAQPRWKPSPPDERVTGKLTEIRAGRCMYKYIYMSNMQEAAQGRVGNFASYYEILANR